MVVGKESSAACGLRLTLVLYAGVKASGCQLRSRGTKPPVLGEVFIWLKSLLPYQRRLVSLA